MRFWVGILVSVIVLSLFPHLPANALAVQVRSITTAPGIVLDTSLYLPKKLPAAAILIAHGFGGTKDSVSADAKYFTDKGFIVLTWSARGFGKSTGLIQMNSMAAEVADSSALISELARNKNVIQDKTGDPRVAIMGASYGGANALLTASADTRVDAVIADITWSNLEQSLFPQSAVNISENGPFKKIWAGTFFTAVTLQSAFLGECGSLSLNFCSTYQSAVLQGQLSKAQRALLASISPINYAESITAPSLLTQGQADSLFPLSESYKTAQIISASHPKTPLSMIWHGAGHDGGNSQVDYLRNQSVKWLKRYLNNEKLSFPAFQFTKSNGSISLQDTTVIPKVFNSPELPFVTAPMEIPLLTPVAALAFPIGGIPSAISALPGIGAASGIAASVISAFAGFSPAFLPGQSGFLESAPLKKSLSIVGPSSVRVRITSTQPDATLFFSLVKKSPSGVITQPNGIVAPIQISNLANTDGEITIELPAVVLDASQGDVIALGISSTDQGYELPKTSRFYSVTATSPLSILPSKASAAQSGSTNFIWPLGALASLLIAYLFIRFRRPKIKAALEKSTALVEVKNLNKVYKDGYQAIVDLSFTVQRGQVVGLLGPNGAGKTTALRVLMGLIFPTKGSLFIDGKSVYPGSPALANLGSFVEGPGFLPHLSGRENLRLYWLSIGRDGDQQLEQVVAITKLGTALDKKVRSYSQGMRQRLAIAQAMLGMPDLLVLDEPTNGLDPQQIAEMRQVLKDYAGTGRTVIISSHLLAEVQQTCSHVVLMHRGELIAFGPMEEILNRNEISQSLEEIFLELIGDDLVIGREKK